MKNIYKISFIALLGIISSNNIFADKYLKVSKSADQNKTSLAEACQPATGATDLDVNNVRARINTGGDMWWDLQSVSRYYIPKNTKKTSMYCGSLWMAGVDVNGQLKCAAQTYRNNGNDFWPGPLTTDNTASIDAATCKKFDKHFKISKSEVAKFIAWKTNPSVSPQPSNDILDRINNWPAHGDPSLGQAQYLAPFYDVNGDGTYSPDDGDYPWYDFKNETCGTENSDKVLFGDQTLWWVFNDKGNIHSQTQGSPVGFEIRAQAFGFATNDEINNMTFYNFQIINRSTYTLTDTYFSLWTDTDLGEAKDDFVGCDVARGLGYCYNGTAVDGTGKEGDYGANPPAVGVDFFQGPYMDPNGKRDTCNFAIGNRPSGMDDPAWCGINGVNFDDAIVDNERFGMRRFVYHNNSGGLDAMTDPDNAPQYYNLLRGIWKDNTKMVYGKNGHISSGASLPCDFMFPGLSDQYDWGTGGVAPSDKNWTEETAGNVPYDRRFMHSAGPFTLKPGATNYITVGIPWARANNGGPMESVKLLKLADDKCQRLFDNCFRVVNGPCAPKIDIQELDNELILYLSNPSYSASNNINEMYPYNPDGTKIMESDFNIITPDSSYQVTTWTYDSVQLADLIHWIHTDSIGKTVTYYVKPKIQRDALYRFEGYMIYQLKDASVNVADVYNIDKARLVAQCDVKNDVSRIVNYEFDASVGGDVPLEKVNGENLGIRHSFRITQDAFATGDKKLINHKKYYYVAVAYGYNNYKTYSQTDGNLDGQKLPFKAGRLNYNGEAISSVVGIPHIPDPEANGTIAQSYYGYGPKITRIEGYGNGGLFLDFSASTESAILNTTIYPVAIKNIEYMNNAGPIGVKVIDPLKVPASDFRVRFVDALDTVTKKTTWELVDVTNGIVYPSDKSISIYNEQIFPEIGLAITIQDVMNAGGDTLNLRLNGLIGSSFSFADSSKVWLTGVFDQDLPNESNWIRAGNQKQGVAADDGPNSIYMGDVKLGSAYADPFQQFEKLIYGTWAPYRMTSYALTNNEPKVKCSPSWGNSKATIVNSYNKLSNLGSVDIVLTNDQTKWTRCPVLESNNDPLLAEGGVAHLRLRSGTFVKDGISEVQGMGWFPGYAICLETGERLNMMYAEDSWLKSDNGNDMKFNPTSRYYDEGGVGSPVFGGKHFIYVLGHNGNGLKDCPAYDRGEYAYNILKNGDDIALATKLFKDIWYTSIPLAVQGKENLWLNNEVRIKIRVAKNYKHFLNQGRELALSPENKNMPLYSFTTTDLQAIVDDNKTAKSALDLINVVPNPYYAYSNYETSQLDNRIKIVNLPEKCEISIFNIGGTLVRQYKKDEVKTSLDWDLKNHAGIPVASGVYLIHVKVDGVGEKVVKWFGTMRPVDLDSF
ncbi:MAG: T9SS C-terminal target domain-containing protein [Bacteroidota bacterium]